jgi:tryptophan-rich sensory protein
MFALCFAAAAVGAWLTGDAIESWYSGLAKPSFNPPNWVFGPAWTALYSMMAVAAWLVWRERGRRDVSIALVLFLVQLALNAAWSGVFFGLRNPAAALAEIAVLWLLIAATLFAFRRVRPVAGWLLAPYLAWVTFASALNFEIWRLN